MKKFRTFVFESFDFDRENLIGKFYYSFDSGAEVFEEIIDFKCNHSLTSSLLRSGESTDDIVLDNFLFQLHLALGISYYKLFPTENLEVKSGYLDDEQIIFWEKFYKNGLGEFFITNDIDPRGLVNFKNSGGIVDIEKLTVKNNYIEHSRNFVEGKTLLLWWGGKDSIVSYSLLKNKKELDLFVFGKIDEIKRKTAEVSWEKILLVKRQLSKNLFKMNEQGYYNGHVPITGIIAFVTFVMAYLYDYSHIVLSNEKSASENNTVWKGLNINHQYSKSLEFEQDLKKYSEKYMTQGIAYFSLLRGMYEYKIASIFAQQKEFLKAFSSCNRNFKIVSPLLGGDAQRAEGGLWCCECEKCCFVFLILSPFLDEKELLSIFWENLFNKKSLEKTFRELIWLEHYKPFECVGTYEECLLSAKKAIQRYEIPFKKEVEAKCDDETEKNLENKLLKISHKDIIPENFKEIL